MESVEVHLHPSQLRLDNVSSGFVDSNRKAQAEPTAVGAQLGDGREQFLCRVRSKTAALVFNVDE